MAEKLIVDGQLTNRGLRRGHRLAILECDRNPCSTCALRNKETSGPGGPDCPVEGFVTTRAELEEILAVYLDHPAFKDSHSQEK